VGVVWRRVLEEVRGVVQQITVQTAGFSGAGDLASPDIQAVGVFAVDCQFFKALLQPLPVLLAVLFGKCGGLRVFLGVALENVGGDEEGGVVYGVYQRLMGRWFRSCGR